MEVIIEGFKIMGLMVIKMVTNFIPVLPIAAIVITLELLISKQNKEDKVSYSRTPRKER